MMNSSNQKYYYEILKLYGFDAKTNQKFNEAEETKIEEILAEYEKNLPKSTTHLRLQLKLLSGERFERKLWSYAKPLIVKGAPALLIDLKADIYKDTAKTQAVEKLILNNLASMEKSNTLVGEEEEQDPTVHLWLMYFASQHFYFLRNFERAFTFIEKAIEHTPTVVDLYVLKAKIYKRAGDKQRACALYEEARKLDLADRYLNALSSRYKIRID